MASPQKVKRIVLVAAVTSITIAGTLYGAGIKTERQVAQQAQKSREITIDERLASLRNMRQGLASKRELVAKQIDDLEARIEERRRKNFDGVKKDPPHNG
ncbi:uncharacterized protein ATNIH1004_010180 [Aspergillus tanneri]|uniref:Uncharacterized protein n=1 Tax=Aspergillus tanneri TaxID=1220188 RepID=A0A5M9M9E5_9EURO|nr:uncharacterized protein ATNIH1004_010180 [Aspergillus tanneri]KAA8643411.1 hypothetical protein ATNIH1004_010180 [Aspergillus tanneri]